VKVLNNTSVPSVFTGVGKSSLVHLLLEGSAITRPAQTIGCTVGVKVSNVCITSFVYLFFIILAIDSHYFSTLLTVVQGVHQIALKVMLKGTSLLNFGMFLGMSVTKSVVHFFIHILMVGVSVQFITNTLNLVLHFYSQHYSSYLLQFCDLGRLWISCCSLLCLSGQEIRCLVALPCASMSVLSRIFLARLR
jgi:hypothetical protein